MRQAEASRRRRRWQHAVVGRAELDRDIVEPLPLNPVAELIANLRQNVLGQYPALRPNHRSKVDGIVALACTDVGNRHARFHSRKLHYLFSLASPVTRIFR